MGEIQGMDSRSAPADWQVGLADPQDPARLLATARIRNQALATSGGYGTAIDAGGRFTHLFDPRTGRARPLYRSVSVMAPNATMADALSTAFSYMPLEAADVVIGEHGLRAWFALPDGGLAVRDAAS
ncbi:FAD:protein FMN transferase [compost metagenome]